MGADARLAVAAAANAPKTALLVKARLFALGTEEAAITQFAQDAGTLHSGLEAP